jgi:restriction system protein
MEELLKLISSMLLLFPFLFIFAFAAWPLVLLGTVPRRKRGKTLAPMLAAWTFLAAGRASLPLFNPELKPISFLFSEPLNTVLFLLTGGVLLALFLGRRVGQIRKFQSMTGAVKKVDDLFNLSPTEFEMMVVELYQANGHKAKRTGQIGDHGVDVVVQTKTGQKWIVQCKRWRGQVGEPVIRDFYGTMHHEKADQGAIIAIGGFSEPARAWAQGKPIYLYDGHQFLKAWQKAQNKKKDAKTTQTSKIQPK